MPLSKKAAYIKQLIKGIPNSQIFSVQFVKKDGTVRDMNCRQNVDTIKHNDDPQWAGHVLLVWDMQKKNYRYITVATVKQIKANGVVSVMAKGAALDEVA
jgi:hypothetical protein